MDPRFAEELKRRLVIKEQREADKKKRKELEAAAFAYLNRRIGLYSTVAQVRAAAKTMVDMDLARVRRGEQV